MKRGYSPRCWWSNVEVARMRHGDHGREYRDALNRPGTCLLPRGHAGPHEFTFDGDVRFVFTPPGHDGPRDEEN